MAVRRPESGRLTLTEVAAQAGVSRATVSLVLRDSPLVAEATRLRVREAAEAVGYLYNRGAATLRAARTKTIGLLVTEIDNPFFAELVAGAEAALDAAGYIAFLAATGDCRDRQGRALRRLREHRVDGILLCPALGTSAAEIADLGLPCVQAMRRATGNAGDFAGPDNRQGMVALAEHLVAGGRRHFAFGGAALLHSGVRERLAGLRQVLRRHGLPPPMLLRTPGTRAGGEEAARLIAALPRRPDALVCVNDVMAFAAIPALQRAGWQVGHDIAVTGVGDVAEAATIRPALTTLRTEPRRIGETAVRLLLRRLQDPDAAAEQAILPTRLVVRDSCGGATPPA
ncbi:LacI family DNA-binding transcriptional regulator [Roseomonas sp. 18066]|uniref:LacI family DNA-binding transcriptional regulator n=1 Tax=Roseomonas sp. 18066 TaxID=2681412 RepID=UPI001358674F|nr:LacI family DNA-binding transcriptional regulator [Roseomonas sp. 18066]